MGKQPQKTSSVFKEPTCPLTTLLNLPSFLSRLLISLNQNLVCELFNLSPGDFGALLKGAVDGMTENEERCN